MSREGRADRNVSKEVVLEDEEVDEELEEEKEENRRLKKSGTGGLGIGRSRRWLGRGGVVDPRAKWVQEWNRAFLLVCAIGLAVDPLFFYALSINDTCMCLFVDGWFALAVTLLRCMADALHLWNMWLQLNMYPIHTASSSSRPPPPPISMAALPGVLDQEQGHDARPRRPCNRVKSLKGFFFDLFVVLPIPQVGLLSFFLFFIFFWFS